MFTLKQRIDVLKSLEKRKSWHAMAADLLTVVGLS